MRTKLAVALVGSALVLLCGPAAALGQWTTELIPGNAAVSPLGLTFDGAGRGLFIWEGFDQQATPQRFTAVDVRDPTSGTWRRAANLPGITWGDAAVDDYAKTRAVLIARQTSSIGKFNRARFRLVYAFGRSTDGSFGAPRRLAEDVGSPIASAANAAGAVLVAYDDANTGALHVSERAPGQSFSRPRLLGTGNAGAAAINARGDRVIAWWGRGGVYARVRRAGHSTWGPAQLAARATPVANATLRAAVTPGGRTVLAWSTADVREDQPTPVAAGVALRDVDKGWRAFGLGRGVLPSSGPAFPVGSPAIPIIDSAGRTYVAWTGVAAGASSVEFAQVTAGGLRGLEMPSGAISGGAVEDAAAGPNQAIVISWSVAEPSATTTYASLRQGSAGFAAAERLTPVGSAGIPGSRAGFASTTGQAVVTWASVSADRQVVLHASASPGTLL